jgi:chromosome condensin MukBEF ATPase and DNA-binding subunit MukB
MDPTLSQGAGLAIDGAYRLGKTFQDSQFLSKYLSPSQPHSNLDFDEIMPELLECESDRSSFRQLLSSSSSYSLSMISISSCRSLHALRLQRLTAVANAFQEPSSSIACGLRNGFLKAIPETVKESLVNRSLIHD